MVMPRGNVRDDQYVLPNYVIKDVATGDTFLLTEDYVRKVNGES